MQPHMKRYIHDLLGIPHRNVAITLTAPNRAPSHVLDTSLPPLTLLFFPLNLPRLFDLDGLHLYVLFHRLPPHWNLTLSLHGFVHEKLLIEDLWFKHHSLITPKTSFMIFLSSLPPLKKLTDGIFSEACLANSPHLYPNIEFKIHLPEFLWKEWDALIDWKADFDAPIIR